MDSTTATIATIASAVTALVTVLLTKGADALYKRQQAKNEAWKIVHDAEHAVDIDEDKRADQTFRFVIDEFKSELATLRVRLDTLGKEHMDCLQMKAQLTERLDSQSKRIAYLEKKLEGRTG